MPGLVEQQIHLSLVENNLYLGDVEGNLSIFNKGCL